MGYLNIVPGGVQTGWLGNDPAGSGLTGAWLKKVWIGGTNAATAPIVADDSGNVTITGILNVGAMGVWFHNGYGYNTIINGGSVSITDAYGTSVIDMSGSGGNALVVRQAKTIYGTGWVRSDQGFNYAGYNGATGTFTSADGKTVTVRGGIITSIV